MKKRLSQAVAAFFAITLLLPGLILAQQTRQNQSPVGSTAGRPNPGAPVTSRRSRRSDSKATAPVVDDFEEALKLVQENYIEGRKLDYNSVFKSSITGMLRSLDPHSNYYDKEEFDELKTDQRSEYYGIGASIQSYSIGEDTDTFITATFENSPAARAGLRFGDRIVEVDGAKMTGKASIDVRDKIRGPRGSVVKITLERAADKRLETVQITRDAVPQPSIPDSYMLKPGVGYVDMTRGFNYSTTEELQGAIDDLHAKGMTSLVLDLRNNPGGFLDQAIHVAELFLPNGQLILTQKGRNAYRDNDEHRSHNGSPDTTPLVILVNEYTASASEIVAGAMQDHDRALIVGKTSFGKGLVQRIINLEYGAGLTLTSAKYYTPSGRLIQRDYSNGGFYDYYTHGGSTRLDQKEQAKPIGPERKTDTGRAVYGGGGIAPDEDIDARTISLYQRRLLSPIFSFAREVANGHVEGFADYKVQRPIEFTHALQPTDYQINEALFKAFKNYVTNQPDLKLTAAQLDHNRAFIALQLRFNLVTAAYGRVMAERVLVTTDDPQVARAVDVLPRARDLAMSSTRARSQR